MRLPVKSLLRFKPACRAWQAIIDDPVFIRAHLRRSASRWEQSHSFIINPHSMVRVPWDRWPVPSNRYRFHQWQLQRGTTTTSPRNNNVATFLHAKDLSDDQQFYTTEFTHRDGLVFSTTTTSLHVFNPATRDAITLPTSSRSNLMGGGRFNYHCSGLGLDPRTGMYKVVQAFFRFQSMEPAETKMGMEVFTIGGGGGGAGWREITSDPPYTATCSGAFPRGIRSSSAASSILAWRKRSSASPPCQMSWTLITASCWTSYSAGICVCRRLTPAARC